MGSKANDKSRVKKGLWKPEEDMILKTYVETHGEGNWATVSAKSGLKRGGKSCRLRWKNYLRPDIKRGDMSMEEQDLIIRMHKLLGNRWSLIAGRLPGRTDNEVKNYWNTHLNKRHQSGKRKTCDSNNSTGQSESGSERETNKRICQPCNSEPSCGVESFESIAEEIDGEKARNEASVCIANSMIWDSQSINYHIESPKTLAINETFVFDDEPFISYLESLLLYESINQMGDEKSSQGRGQPQMP